MLYDILMFSSLTSVTISFKSHMKLFHPTYTCTIHVLGTWYWCAKNMNLQKNVFHINFITKLIVWWKVCDIVEGFEKYIWYEGKK